jgi:LysR family glycine cleavage system transcriptional activator
MNEVSIRLPPLSAVRAFEAAARHGGFTRAAVELGMTQAAVSYQIRQLEQRLGVALFRRLPRRVALTAEGERLAAAVTDAFDGLRAAFAAVTHTVEGVLSIQALPTIASNWLVPRLGSFQSVNPALAVRLVTQAQPADPQPDDCDVAIRSGSGSWAGLEAHWLLPSRFTPLCSPDLLRAIGDDPEPTDLFRFRLLGSPERWRRWFAAAGLSDPGHGDHAPVKLGVQQFEVTAAIAGNGVAMVTPDFFRRELADGLLVQPFDLVIADGHDYWLTYPALRRGSAKIRLFRDWVLQEAREP